MGLDSTLFLGCYFFILTCLAVFGWHRYFLTYLYYRYQKVRPVGVPRFEDLKEVPFVTVQLPVFNEKYVIERLIEQVCRLDYPSDKLEVQVLDDSTDETRQIAEAVVKRFQEQGVIIQYLHREKREGYKAGALAEGLSKARGKYIAVFDADFLPPADFLKKLIPYFYGSKKYGMVQARWGHLNQNYSLMTQAQSVLLDGHFVIEHTARSRSGRFFNFNGTAGVWDRACVEEAGGWQYDTLTEDLDLSYRAQLEGWNFLYVPEIVAPAELPVDMNAFKSQQHRWAKGSIQTAKKLLPRILRSSLPWRVKAEAFFHLFNNLAYLLMVVLSVMMPVSIYIRWYYHLESSLWVDLPIFVFATLSIGTFYACSQREIYPDWKARLWYLPFNLAIGIGLAVNNSKAVLEALLGKKSEFTRTAKFAISKKSDRWQNKKYKTNVGVPTAVEILLGVYFTVAMVFSLVNRMWASAYCLLFFQVGFLYVGMSSLFQGRPLIRFSPRLETSSMPAE
jgi:cellulose synthase/poly-beta-1,6-N-acetylglucosamine synthase-like glycosyltransferase